MNAATPHIVSPRVYYLVFAVLIVLTAITVSTAFADLGRLNTVIALSIATIKAMLVALFFMDLRDSSRLTWVVIGAGVFWLAVMIALVMSDMLTRGWLGYPGK